MPSFGEKLKLEREKRNVTLEQISVSTKIGTRMLRALEEDKFSELPGGIFNKGFVRAYSRVLGLDEDKTVADYLQASGDALPTRADAASHESKFRDNPPSDDRSRTGSGGNGDDKSRHDSAHHDSAHHDSAHHDAARRAGASETEENILRMEADADATGHQLPWGIFAALLLAVALVLSLWSRYERERSRRPGQPTSNTTAALPLPASQSSGNVSGVAASPVASPLSLSKSNGIPSAPASVPAGEFSLVIQAREESWITITSDGKTISSELLTAGSERKVRGHQQIVVKTGNAGGVDFQLNGKKVDAAGQYGEVKTIAFGPRGII